MGESELRTGRSNVAFLVVVALHPPVHTRNQPVTANVELSSPKEERPDVVLDQSIMLEILISFFLLFLLIFFEDVGLVLEHIVERELP